MKDTINLLPKKSLEIRTKGGRGKSFLPFGIILSLFLFIWLIAFFIQVAISGQRQKIRSEIAKQEQVIKSRNADELAYRTVFNKAKAAEFVFAGEQAFLAHLRGARNLANEGITIREITIGATSAKLTVGTSDIAPLLNYLTTLEGEGQKGQVFKKLTITSIDGNKSGYEVKIEGSF
jgi:hypothetical protein